MLDREIERLYLKFRLLHYQTLFLKLGERDGSLSATEAFAVEAIYLLDRPTVKEFSDFLHISQPNATYKINNLVAKGYLKKNPSPDDKREFRLEVTEKFLGYHGTNSPFLTQMLQKIGDMFTPEEIGRLEEMVRRITDEAL